MRVGICDNERFHFSIRFLAIQLASDIAGLLMVGESNKTNSSAHPSDWVGEEFARDQLSKETKVIEQVDDYPRLRDSSDVEIGFGDSRILRSRQTCFEEMSSHLGAVELVGCLDCFSGQTVLGEGIAFSLAGLAIVDHVETGHLSFRGAQLAEFGFGGVRRDVIDDDFSRDFLGFIA